MSHYRPAGALWPVAILASLVGAIAGCGGSAEYQLAPVSGIVTLDGKAIPNTQVIFVPQGTAENPSPGPGSTAFCDEAGHFDLKTVRGEPGAVVGAHRVQISQGAQKAITELSDEGGPLPKDPFPAKYNTESELTFTVPEDGDTNVKFELPSK